MVIVQAQELTCRGMAVTGASAYCREQPDKSRHERSRFAASGTYMTGSWLIGRENDRKQKAKQNEEETGAVTALGKTV